LTPREPPCVSVYLPTHRRRTEGRSDIILFRNLARDVEDILGRDLPGVSSREIVERLKAIDQEEFWAKGQRSDGLAIFVALDFLRCYRLPAQFPELNVVGGSFHTKPLVRFLQGNAMTYHLLALNTHRVVLYEGMGNSIQEVPLREVPQAPGSHGGHGRNEVQHAERQKGTKEYAKIDIEKFFRTVAKTIWKNHLRSSSKPLILAAPRQHHSLFRKVAHIPVLLESGIVADPMGLSVEDLKAEARRVLEPEVQSRMEKRREEFGLACSKGQGSEDLAEVARAVAAGRVKTLLVESGRRIWGIFDTRSGQVLPGDSSRNAHDTDLLDLLAESTLGHAGEVFVLPKAQMPTRSGVAAILRF